MTDKIFEQDLSSFDYSVFSRVKNRLLDELLEKHRNDNMKNFQILTPTIISEEILSDDELDYVVAAGKNFTDKRTEKKS